MAKEKTNDIRLLKLVSKTSASRNLTMGYLLYQSEILRTNADVTYNISFLPIVKNEAEDLPLDVAQETEEQNKENQIVTPDKPEFIAKVHEGLDNEFRRDNRLTAVVDIMSKTIRFPHMSKFKLDTAYRGYGLGSYAMNELVAHLKSSFPDFNIEPVYFYFDHKRDDEDRDAFFAFMEKFGFWFKFDDANNNKGLLNIEKADMLKNTVKKDTCTEIELAPFIRGLFKERDTYRRDLARFKAEYKKNNTYMNRFEKDQAIKFLTNVIIALCLLIVLILFL